MQIDKAFGIGFAMPKALSIDLALLDGRPTEHRRLHFR